MQTRRATVDPRGLCSGPGKLAQALAITGAEDGLPLDQAPFVVLPRATEVSIAIGTRIGITKAPDEPWRFGLAGSRFVSRRFPPLLRVTPA